MCKTSKCLNQAEGLCYCPPVKNRGEKILALIEHVTANVTNIRWEMDYTDINRAEKRRPCMVDV